MSVTENFKNPARSKGTTAAGKTQNSTSVNWNEMVWNQLNDLADTGIMTTDTELNIRTWNRWLEERSGVRADEVIGRNLLDVCPELVTRSKDQYFREALKGQVSILAHRFHEYLIPLPPLDKDAAAGYMQQSARVAPLVANEQVVGAIALIEDITERVERVAELWRQVEALDALRHIGHAILTLDLSQCLRQVVDAATVLTGAPEAVVAVGDEEMLSVGAHSDAGTPIDTSRLNAANCVAVNVVRSGKPVQVADAGTTDYLLLINPSSRSGLAAPLVIGDKVIGALIVESPQPHAFDEPDAEQVTRLATQAAIAIRNARVHETLRDSEAELRALFAAMNDYVFVFDADGRCVKAVPTGAVTGHGTEDQEGKTVHEIWPEATAVTLLDTIRKALETQQLVQFEYKVTVRGEHSWYSGVVSPMTADTVLLVDRDVTETKQLEAQLAQAQKMGAVGRMAGGIAHDFNNLLTTVIGNATFARDGCPPGSQAREDIQTVIDASKRAASLIRRLMAFTRHQIITPTTIDPNALVLELDKMLRRVIGEDTELVVLPGYRVGNVKADSSQMEQVLMNLIVNARDAMPDGGKITVTTANVTLRGRDMSRLTGVTPGDFVVLTVSDTGTGMSDEVQAHLFEPFFTTKEIGQGAGLGLATVYGIVKQHRGDISVHSELGVGTTVKIYLPQINEALEQSGAPADQETLPTGDETVLLVEDEAAVRDITARHIRELGYSVLEAANGHEALAIAQRHEGEIHLLLTDVVMPQVSGPDLADQLLAVHPTLAVLFMSGYSQSSVSHHNIRGQKADFLDKPFTRASLAHAIRTALGD